MRKIQRQADTFAWRSAMADTTQWHPLIRHNGEIEPTGRSYNSGSYEIRIPDKESTIGKLIAELGYSAMPPGGIYNREHPEVYIDSVMVHPDHRGQGVAQALVERLAKDHPNHKINPGATTPQGTGFTQRMQELHPDQVDRIAPGYEPYVLDDEDTREFEDNETRRLQFAMRKQAIELTDEEAEAFLKFIEQNNGKLKAKFKEPEKVEPIPAEAFEKMFAPMAPSGKWYHVSPHELAPGTDLIAGGPEGKATSQNFYDMGYGDDEGTLADMGAGRNKHIWVTPDLDDAHFWSAALNAPHIYEVDADDDPQPWNGTGTDGWVTTRAKIRTKVNDALKEASAALRMAASGLSDLSLPSLSEYFPEGEPTPPPSPSSAPTQEVLNRWLKKREQTPNPTPRSMQTWGNKLEKALYQEFMDWWPNSLPAQERKPEESMTHWKHHPTEPITHWMNVEDFLNERYPEAATNSVFGYEDARPSLSRVLLSPEESERSGYIGSGNAITQAFLNLHNKLQGRDWASKEDQRKYFELMLRHIGPNAVKRDPIKAAALVLRYATAVLDKDQELQDLYQMQKEDEVPSTPPVVVDDEDYSYPEESAGDILNQWATQRGRKRPKVKEVKCDQCSGSGRVPVRGGTDPCYKCNGDGAVMADPKAGTPAADLVNAGSKLEKALYNEFMQWWPNSEAAKTRRPETSNTQWEIRPKQPITHWLNVEDFLKERYPEAATGATLGIEQAHGLLQRQVDGEDLPTPEWLESHGYVGNGNAITQAMLGLHNRLNKRKWRDMDDKRRYYELMLRHVGPGAVKRPKTAAIPDLRFEHFKDPQYPATMAFLNGERIGLLRWYPESGLVRSIDVEPPHRGKGVATALVDWTRANAAPHLKPSPVQTEMGKGFDQSYEHKTGAFNPNLVYKLQKEFDTYAGERDLKNPFNNNERGPIGYWPHIESFLKEKYPASHRGLSCGFEDAQYLLDDPDGHFPWLKDDQKIKYETGPEAKSQYGYDPAEIAAGMLLLHNQSHPRRQKWQKADQDRLVDIAQKRYQMQRAYEERQKTASLSDGLLTRLSDEFKQWHKQQPKGSLIGAGTYGGTAQWPNIEKFLSNRYPAAYRGLEFGLEDAGALLDGNEMYHVNPSAKPYETGPDAEAQHGYDPREIVAAMLAMHNSSDEFRMNTDPDIAAADIERLNDIAQKRFEMQRKFEQRTAAHFMYLDGTVDDHLAKASSVLRMAKGIMAGGEADYDDTPYWAVAWDDEDDDDETPHKRKSR